MRVPLSTKGTHSAGSSSETSGRISDDRGCVVDGGGVAKQKRKPKTALPKDGRNLKGMGHAKRGLTGTGRRRGLVEEP